MCTQSGDYVDAIAARKHAVDDEHIESAGFCKRESIGEIRRACYLLTGLNQALDEDLAPFEIILDYEKSSKTPSLIGSKTYDLLFATSIMPTESLERLS